MLAVMNTKNKLQRKAAYTDLLSLRCFRSGIESGISWLKQCMGLTRCTWKGWEAFKSYAWSSIVANEPSRDLSAISDTLGFR